MTYLEWLAKYPPKPITTDAEYQKALRQFEKLMTPHPARPLAQLLEVHATLIEEYESREYPTPEVSPAEMLDHLMEVHGVSASELAEATGINVGTISSVRNGHRGLSKENVVKLAGYFKVSTDAFLAEPKRKRA